MGRVSTRDAARGKWKGVLLTLGVSADFLTGKHGPCPMCGGTDRFRWDNKGGDGGYICGGCGAGDGFDLLKKLNGWDFKAAATEVDAVVGNIAADPIKRPMDEDKRNAMLNRLWTSGLTIRSDNPVARYLGSRRVDPPQNADCLRYVERCPLPDRCGFSPAMIAMVTDGEGKPVTLHRTFVRADGTGKADVEKPRALMPGTVPDGSAIRLATNFGEVLGIAEGIETALAATRLFDVPTWATLNSSILAKWSPPPGVREIVVFGDNDPQFGGNLAAYTVARRLSIKGLKVRVEIPTEIGKDWADYAA